MPRRRFAPAPLSDDFSCDLASLPGPVLLGSANNAGLPKVLIRAPPGLSLAAADEGAKPEPPTRPATSTPVGLARPPGPVRQAVILSTTPGQGTPSHAWGSGTPLATPLSASSPWHGAPGAAPGAATPTRAACGASPAVATPTALRLPAPPGLVAPGLVAPAQEAAQAPRLHQIPKPFADAERGSGSLDAGTGEGAPASDVESDGVPESGAPADSADPKLGSVSSGMPSLDMLPPSVGSAVHMSGTCKRCAFFLRGMCVNGSACEYCHFEHERRRRRSRAKKKANTDSTAEEVRAVNKAVSELGAHADHGRICCDAGTPIAWAAMGLSPSHGLPPLVPSSPSLALQQRWGVPIMLMPWAAPAPVALAGHSSGTILSTPACGAASGAASRASPVAASPARWASGPAPATEGPPLRSGRGLQGTPEGFAGPASPTAHWRAAESGAERSWQQRAEGRALGIDRSSFAHAKGRPMTSPSLSTDQYLSRTTSESAACSEGWP
eukprot:CAMPEP_0168399736 /NCGR_PEP_ID=MMETSP0228-20121227/22240_1 /TAXON_ID=133427 /ORGANISM="Protoceratium reticulatum, Strain CCCM 535 (=CCMP 1889)" /LENGTH=496 /DNA_ID=CAMNT_0008413263 /DNA_START=26 /DNA_END=1518 /DNA_ORIENTATION=+